MEVKVEVSWSSSATSHASVDARIRQLHWCNPVQTKNTGHRQSNVISIISESVICCACTTDLRTVSAERRWTRGDRSKGWPSLSQLIWGWGVPVALHSSVTTLCRVVCTSRGTLVSPLMEGGTAVQKAYKLFNRFVLCLLKHYRERQLLSPSMNKV